MRRAILYSLGVLAVLLVLACGGSAWVLEGAAHLVLGWYANSRQVLPRVTVNLAGVAMFIVLLPLTAVLAHSMCRWLWQGGRSSGDHVDRPWRWKWTLIGLSTVMLMFAAGVAATGVVHQTGWLVNSPVPLIRMRQRPLVLQIKCSSNLRQIGYGVLMYINAGGHWPTSRAELAKLAPSLELSPDVFVCPAGPHDRAPGTRPAEWSAALDDERHFSYVVAPRPLPSPDGERHVMIYEPLNLHDDGINVLYDDAHVEWLDRPAAERWLAMIESESRAGPTTAASAPALVPTPGQAN